jgi:hypothetical protein
MTVPQNGYDPNASLWDNVQGFVEGIFTDDTPITQTGPVQQLQSGYQSGYQAGTTVVDAVDTVTSVNPATWGLIAGSSVLALLLIFEATHGRR